MRLQIESIDIEDVHLGAKTSANNHILSLNAQELENIILQDKRIQSVELKVVSPGESVRIINVVDVIQPRCKVDSEIEDFPGYLGKMAITGNGKTRSLRGVAVILSNSASKRSYASLIDMFGIGAERSIYGKMKNLVVHPHPSADTEERDFEHAVKLAGFKTAVYLARAASEHPVDQTDIYELDIPRLLYETKSNLPKVAYYYMLHTPQHDYKGIGDPILYGARVTELLPTIIHPNEVLDGAIVSTHTIRAMETYSIQNHAVIKELYNRHGKDLIFVGTVIGVASVDPLERLRMTMMAANLITNVLGADGAILTKVHGGVPNIDLSMLGETCEAMGVKTALSIHFGPSSGTWSDSLLFNTDHLNAIANVGDILERMCLPQADIILGGTVESPIYNPEFKQKAGDKTIDIEEFLLAGLLDHNGGSTVISSEY